MSEQLSGATAVFDPETGETHYLSELPAILLACVADEPSPCPTLLTRMAGPIDLDETAESRVLAALVYLERAELVESYAPKTD